MKITTFSVSLFLIFVWQLLSATMRDPNNPPTGRTGAPSETTCETAGCHSGGAYTGTVTISGMPDTVFANENYTITLTNTSNSVRAGFEMTCLDGNNTKCGTFSTASGCSVATASGRQYIRQSTPKNLSNGSTSWTFPWKAPASANGDQATFYFVSLASNGNGKNTGDNALKATKTVVFQSALTATNQATTTSWLQMYPTLVTKQLQVHLLESTSGQLQIFNQQGQMVLQTPLSAANNIQVENLPQGLYLAHIQSGEKQTTQKFIRL